MKKIKKTNAMRLLDQQSIPYKVYTYEVTDNKIDGKSVADKISKPYDNVYKTLVTKGKSNQYYVFCISVEEELDLKKAAKAVGEKSVEMLAAKNLQAVTGYIRGGCSPLGMKTEFMTVVDEYAGLIEDIVFSGGKIGIQLEVKIDDFIKATKCLQAAITTS